MIARIILSVAVGLGFATAVVTAVVMLSTLVGALP